MNQTKVPICLAVFTGILLVIATAKAQTLPSGVINTPPMVIGDTESIGSDTILNVLDGGSVGKNLDVGASDESSVNLEFNISGGTAGLNTSDFGERAFNAYSGSIVTISGGEVGFNSNAYSGSIVNISGGFVGLSTSIFNLNTFNAYSGSVVNISGGELGDKFSASIGSEVNISGGQIGDHFLALNGSVINVSGGLLGRSFISYSGSEINISGGEFGDGFRSLGSVVNVSGGILGRFFQVFSDSNVTFSGGEFLLNGVTPSVSPITLNSLDVLTGTLEDGSTFVFSPQANDSIVGVNLINTTVPEIDTTPIIINSNVGPANLRQGQTLTLEEGGLLSNGFVSTSATLNIAGGTTGSNMEFVDSQVNLSDGEIGTNSAAYDSSEVNINGGTVRRFFRAYAGSIVNVTNGFVDSFFVAGEGSEVNVTGGEIGDHFEALPGSFVNITGGTFGNGFDANAGSQVILKGGEFLLNGDAIVSENINLNGSYVLTGTLEDGSIFLFTPLNDDSINDLTLVSTSVPFIDTTPITISDQNAPVSIRSGQTLSLENGGLLRDGFRVIGSNLNIIGGIAGNQFEASGSQVTISGGVVGIEFKAFAGSTVDISGGAVGVNFEADFGSVVNISAGSIGEFFQAHADSKVNVTGGAIDDRFTANSGSEVNISGGSIGHNFNSFSGSVVNVSGGVIGSSANSHGVMNIVGGIIHSDFDASGVVNISGGELGAWSNAEFGSVVNISGGEIGFEFSANSGSLVNISGGEVGDDFIAYSGSVVNISGGELGKGFIAKNGSEVNISGGIFGNNFRIDNSSSTKFFGGEFMINGIAPVNSIISLATGSPGVSADIFTGTLANGSVFLFTPTKRHGADIISGDRIDNLSLINTTLAAPNTIPMTISAGNGPTGLRQGETLTVVDDGYLKDDFTAIGGTLNIAGGSVGARLEVASAQVNISGGNVGSHFRAFSGSEINISGGFIGDDFIAEFGSIVNVTGGDIEHGFAARFGSVVNFSGGYTSGEFSVSTGSALNISGGRIGTLVVIPENASFPSEGETDISGGKINRFSAYKESTIKISGGEFHQFTAYEESKVNISGGYFLGRFSANFDSEVNLFGTSFDLDGVLLDSLTIGEVFVIQDREKVLSGIFVDGPTFSFELYTSAPRPLINDFFSNDAILTITLVSHGDFNADGSVNGSDFLAWQRGELSNPLSPSDLTDWQAYYGSTASQTAIQNSVPEPSTLFILMVLSFISLPIKHVFVVNLR